MNPQFQKKPILIVLVAGIGDLVLGSRSIRAIHNGAPDREIYLLTSTDTSAIALNYPYIDHVVPFPIRELRTKKTRIFEMLGIVRRLRRTHFELVVNLYAIGSLPGAFWMGLLLSSLRAEHRVGHDRMGFGLVVDRKAPANTFEDRHWADGMMDLAVLAGGVPDKKGIEVFGDGSGERNWGNLFSREPEAAKNRNVAINPGSDRQNKRWDPGKYASLADMLVEKCGANVLLLGGSGEEGISRGIQDRMKHDAIDLAGKLTLNDLVYVIGEVDLLVTNDSGPMHIAAAVDTPQVAIFGTANPKYFSPYTSTDSFAVVQGQSCERPPGGTDAEVSTYLDNITVDEVLAASEQMLHRRDRSE